MVWNMLPKRVARYLRRGRNYAEPFSQASSASVSQERVGVEGAGPDIGGPPAGNNYKSIDLGRGRYRSALPDALTGHRVCDLMPEVQHT